MTDRSNLIRVLVSIWPETEQRLAELAAEYKTTKAATTRGVLEAGLSGDYDALHTAIAAEAEIDQARRVRIGREVMQQRYAQTDEETDQ